MMQPLYHQLTNFLGGQDMSDHGEDISGISRVPWYTELSTSCVFFALLAFFVSEAIEVIEGVPDDNQADFIIWTIKIWFAFRITGFGLLGIIGAVNRKRFEYNKNKVGFAPKHIDILQFCYQIPIVSLIQCVTSVIKAAVAATAQGTTVTYVILISEEGELGRRDIRIIRRIAASFHAEGLEVVVRHQEHGKRDAFDKGFQVINNRKISCAIAETGLLVLDGDTEIPREFEWDFLARIFAPISLVLGIVATTINNFAKVDSESPWVIRMFILRFLRRFYMMSANPMVLTGRASAFHGVIARDREFQEILVTDLINHQVEEGILTGNPLLAPGRLFAKLTGLSFLLPREIFHTLTGDDKSTFYFVLSRGYDIVFNPELYVICHEDLRPTVDWLPDIWFLQLPAYAIRYCRNTANNQARLLALGIGRLDVLQYVSLMIDRYLFWMTVVGLMALPFLMSRFGAEYAYVHFSWVLISRTFMTVVICWSAGQMWSAYYPIILYNEHTSLGFVKLWAVIDAVSGWTRQGIDSIRHNRFWNILAFCTIVAMMFLVIGMLSGEVRIPDISELSAILQLL